MANNKFWNCRNAPVLIVKDESDIQNTPRNLFLTCFNPPQKQQLSDELSKSN